MKKLFFSSMLLGGLMMASCSEDVMDAPVQEEVNKSFAQSFVEKFGTINANQDWNAAKVEKITLNGGTSRAAGNNVTIYGKYGNSYKVVGVWENTTATEFNVTVPETVTEFVAAVNDEVFPVQGSSITVNRGSRTYANAVEGDYWDALTDYKDFPKADLDAYFRLIPEGQDNRKKVGVSTNFMFYRGAENETVTVYPVFWNAAYSHNLGIYWFDEEGKMHTNRIYYNKKGEDVKVDGQIPNYKAYSILDGHSDYENISSRGFNVTVPAGKLFGFYIEVFTENKNNLTSTPDYVWYSDASLNTDGQPHIAYTKPTGENNRRFLSFDDQPITYSYNRCGTGGGNIFDYNKDYHNGNYRPGYNYPWGDMQQGGNDNNNSCGGNSQGNKPHKRPGHGHHWPTIEPERPSQAQWTSDRDMNDFVFIIESEMEAMEFEPQEWVVAIEDLGAQDDFDFNDVVFKVNHVSGQETAVITPLAAGGTLETYLYQGENKVVREDGQGNTFDEFHELLGATEGTYPMINTTSKGAAAAPIVITVPADFTMALNTKENIPMSIGNFWVEVKGNNAQNANVKVTAPGEGEAPQMICVPAAWAWPTERTSINLAYPDFRNWVNNPNYYDWVNTPVTGKVVAE